MFGSGQPIFVFRGPFGVPVEIHSSIIFLAMLFVGFGATAGPIVNLALWAIGSLVAWWLAGWIVQARDSTDIETAYLAYYYLQTFAWINLILFVLNLVPVQPLDGGKLLHLGLLRVLPEDASMRIAGGIGLVFAILWLPAMLMMYFQFGWMLLFFPPITVHWKMARGEIRG